MKNLLLCSFITCLLLSSCEDQPKTTEVEKWDVFEILLNGPKDGNPFIDIKLEAIFQSEESEIEVPGFYDGNGRYLIRFAPPEVGTWAYKTRSNHNVLNSQSGTFKCIEPGPGNHGPLKIVDTYYLEYADGTPFFSIGTTAYQWTSVKQSIQDKTIKTLKTAPFNKIRMCVFPKHYIYGNETEPWAYPFERSDSVNNYDKPNYAFFQNFDRRIRQLQEMGIQADVILFHPYDKHWGYYLMGDELNERYVRYMISRISAYSNVWWSLANEWDVPSIKDTVDWEGIGNLLMKEDPHNRFRGIHNWYNSEDHFYDHSRTWITHVSTQTSQFYNVEHWKRLYEKPIMFDEMRYEGDVPSGWGNLSGEEMSRYFWEATFSGAYPTHGETLVNNSDTLTEVRWWAKGGELVGESPARIAYFKSIMEQIPYREMISSPTKGTSSDSEPAIYQLKHRESKLVMSYVPEEGVNVELSLSPNDEKYLYIVDTWNMKVLDQKVINDGSIQIKTSVPHSLLILSKTQLAF